MVKAWRRRVLARRSRFWKEKTALDRIADLTERRSWRMIGFVLLRRMGAISGRPIDNPEDTANHSLRKAPSPAATNAMPRVIFQTWKVAYPLPENYRYWSASFTAQNPSYEHIIWDDADNRAFIAAEFSWFLPHYDRYPQEIFRVDIVRLFFLYRHGGLYADMDTECLRPLDDALGAADVVLGAMGGDPAFAYAIPNAVMASKPRQLFWLLAIANAVDRIRSCNEPSDFVTRGPEFFTGAILIRDSVLEYRVLGEAEIRSRLGQSLPEAVSAGEAAAGEIAILPDAVWYPINWNNLWQQRFRRELLRHKIMLSPREARVLFPGAHLASYWTHSW